jgi:hypothetical protein
MGWGGGASVGVGGWMTGVVGEGGHGGWWWSGGGGGFGWPWW